jgi:hypothetical protein
LAGDPKAKIADRLKATAIAKALRIVLVTSLLNILFEGV